MEKHNRMLLLSIDQGTTSTRAMVFEHTGKPVSSHQISFQQYFPNNGWVEHDPKEIWQTTLECCQQAMKRANAAAKDIAAIGISNQRETTILWDKKTGEAVYPAIVWQDRRTAETCEKLAQCDDIKKMISEKTGLLLDPYFSATKIAWILDHVPEARKRAEAGELLCGTVDAFLLWKFTEGKVFATDATNASRTLLFNIHTQQWDNELLALFNIPKKILPAVLDSNARFGETTLLGGVIPITGIAGDQQAAMIGQACFTPGMMKSTYGTGCFVVVNTGKEAVHSRHHLLSTIAYRINGEVTYALEGSIFCAGVGMQWLTQNLKLLASAGDSEKIMQETLDTDGVYFIPAFTGLGAPHWNADARAAIVGITRDTQSAHIVRAALEAVCYQTRDLIEAIKEDFMMPIQVLHVDGGMTKNNVFLQFLADMVNVPVARNICIETSALGAAMLAGLGVGIHHSLQDITHCIQSEKAIIPITHFDREKKYHAWQRAVKRVL